MDVSLSVRFSVFIVVLSFLFACGRHSDEVLSSTSETHPFQEQLRCKRANGSIMRGEMYAVGVAGETLLSIFDEGHVANCEFALRSSRNGKVCIDKNSRYVVIDIATRQMVSDFGRDFNACIASTKMWSPLETRNGYVQFIDDKELSASLRHLPNVSDTEINAVLQNPDTIWYDEASMVFSYQDSFGNPTGPEGLRANRVGYDVGSTNDIPDIRALTEYFEPSRFKFPFSVAAGGTDRSNVYVLNYWWPPRDALGKVLPVKWWKTTGSHWHWTFPVGTIIGEVLLSRDGSDTDWYVFEVRSRKRERTTWRTDIFRPFTRASEFSEAIKEKRPNWASSDLATLVGHLEDSSKLIPAKLESTPYRQVFPTINGFYDELPATSDHGLIKELLSERIFQSAMNAEWKTNGDKKTYAPTSKSGFNIVPNGYIAGLLQNSEESCKRCHSQTGRALGQLDGRIQLYGEIWGEDQIFTWHPFKVTADIFTVSDGSRQENPRMVAAGLIDGHKPAANDPNYGIIPLNFPQ